jgi:hypothetical protein
MKPKDGTKRNTWELEGSFILAESRASCDMKSTGEHHEEHEGNWTKWQRNGKGFS